MKYSITRIQKYKMKYDRRTIRVLDEFKKKNNLDFMYLEEYLKVYEIKENFTLKDLIEKLETICSIILSNGHLTEGVSEECIEEKLSRHFNEGEYEIILAVDRRDIDHYACEEEVKKIQRAGTKKRRKRLWNRYSYENPLNRIHGFVVYNRYPGPKTKIFDKRALCIDIIGSNPYASKNGFKGVGAYLLLYIVMLGKIHKFDKIILEIANDKAEIEDECDENDTGENDDIYKAKARKGLENMTRKQLKKIAKYYFLDLGGLKLHIINRILWHEYDEEWSDEELSDEEDEDSDEDGDENSGEDSDENSDEEDEEDEEDGDENSDEDSDENSDENSGEDGDEDSDEDDEDDWYFPIYEPLYIGVDIFAPWNYEGKDPVIYGYGGTRYIEGKESAKDLYLWYEKYGFVENRYLNTHDKYFDMTPLPAMELNLNKYKMKKICQAFLENKCLK